MQDLYRVAHYLAFHDHFEVGGRNDCCLFILV